MATSTDGDHGLNDPQRPRYAELIARTNYSFLQGASTPEELVLQATALGLDGLAITDRDGVYGMPKAYSAAKEHPSLKFITGAELTLKEKPPLILLARDRQAYGVLCRILTASHRDAPKGEAFIGWEEFLGMMNLPGAEGLVALALPRGKPLADPDYGTLHEVFGANKIFIPVSHHFDGHDSKRLTLALETRRRFGIPIVATNDVHYHCPSRRPLQDVLTATRHLTSVHEAGRKLHANAERHLKSAAEMAHLFRDLPEAIHRTLEIADSCTFSPAELRYRYPSEWIPAGETAQEFLERLTWEGARTRYPEGIPEEVRAQIIYEFKLIGELRFADYFLTIWEIIDFARKRKILCQGRGSAANSVVCYCLGITAVDPVRMKLLFERFLSAERGEPPDIDVDFEHERREEVIQHIYEKYGRDRAAMVSAVITYRTKSAIRDVTRALALPGATDAPPSPQIDRLVEEIKGFPRHLSIHSGGFTLSADPIIEIVPVEPARMENRTIIQWDKYDLDILGLIKVDVLSLGMLSAIRKSLDQVGLEMYRIPDDDPATYAMIQKCDTVGVFQIESRAQMSMLGRLKPENFYDLVVEVAIVRPGPIVGKMVHPYLRRRQGLEPVEMPDPRLEPILGRTLGVPIFQEQIMKIAIVLARFTPGEADQLRRAIGAWRSSGSIEAVGQKLRDRLLTEGLPAEFVDRIFAQIKGFAEYGFPESHAASFALIAYVSSYLKCHFPAVFTAALINSQPMGFYSNYTLIEDVRRHGVQVLAVHPNLSEWDCIAVTDAPGEPGTIQLGWKVVKGLGEAQARELIDERKREPFRSLRDFLNRSKLRRDLLHQLAIGDAFKCFGFDQRHSLWEILEHDLSSRPSPDGQLSLFTALDSASEALSETAPETALEASSGPPPLFEPMEPYTEIRADYSTYGLSVRGHPMGALRTSGLAHRLPEATSREVRARKHGTKIESVGMIIVRQRPPTAHGTTFATLEDEHGFLDLILHRGVYERFRELFDQHSFLIVHGSVQREGHSISVLVQRLEPIFPLEEFHSRSWH